MRIGIIGLGVVGKALAEYYRKEFQVYTFDKATDAQVDLSALNANAEVVFVCVNTPYDEEKGGLDCSNAYDAVNMLTGEKTVIIKSTVMPGTTDDLQAKYPQHRFFFVPEFLSADTAAEDYAHPRRSHVVGCPAGWPNVDRERYGWTGSDDNAPSTWSLWDNILPPKQKYHPRLDPGVKFLPARQAELLKLATNAFYAMKVTFANQLYDIDATQEMLDALAEDPWVGNSHFKVWHKGYRGYGGACLPKDTRALADYASLPQFGSVYIGDCVNCHQPGWDTPFQWIDDYNTDLRKCEEAKEKVEQR